MGGRGAKVRQRESQDSRGLGQLRQRRQRQAQRPDRVQRALEQLQPRINNSGAAVHAAARLPVPAQARLHALHAWSPVSREMLHRFASPRTMRKLASSIITMNHVGFAGA